MRTLFVATFMVLLFLLTQYTRLSMNYDILAEKHDKLVKTMMKLHPETVERTVQWLPTGTETPRSL